MSKTRINYKSDFSLDVTFAINGVSVPLPVNDFLVRFFIDGAPGTTFVCGHKDGEYINCEKKDNDTLTCYIDNHKFGCGRLCCEFVDLKGNDKFADKVQKTVTPGKLGIVLVDGAGDTSTNISASVLVDIEAVISDLRDALESIEGKLNYYDASWVYNASTRTVENFNAMLSVVEDNSVVIMLDSQVLHIDTYDDNNILYTYNVGLQVRSGVIILDGDTVTWDEGTSTGATSGSVTALGGRVTSAEGDISSLDGRIDVLETWKTNVGTAASIVHYVDCDWLDNGSGTLQNYTTLHDGILADHKVLLKNSQTAIYYTANDTNNTLTVVFFSGSRLDTYTVTKGPSGCTVVVSRQFISLEVAEAAAD